MPNFAVIDLGSNSVRLCIYQVRDIARARYSRKDIKTLANNKAMAGLSAYVKDGVFTPPGIERAIEALTGHAKRLRYFECAATEVFATAVLRNCTNSKAALRAIEKGCGLPVTLLSADEEAHLGFVGVSCERHLTHGTLIDIGGGSTEMLLVKEGVDTERASLPLGSLSAFAQQVSHILPIKDEARAIVAALDGEISRLPLDTSYEGKDAFGIGGSIRAAAKFHAEAFGNGVRPDILLPQDFDRIIEMCLRRPADFAHLALKAVPERIHTLVPGCLIAHRLMQRHRATSLTVCKKGLREGYLIERMLKAQAVACDTGTVPRAARRD